jgi:hypothetical protein
MSAEREHPHVIPTPAAVEQAAEDRILDEALQVAVREITASLQREEIQQRQRRIVMAWIPIAVLALIAIIVGFSLPHVFQETPMKRQPQPAAIASPAVPQQLADYTLRLPRGYEW